MEHLTEVLENCANYDFITNYTPKKEDVITIDLIRFYQDYVFFNWNKIKEIKKIDLIIGTYVKDRQFFNYIHQKFEIDGEVLPVYEVLNNLYDNYEEEKLKEINTTVWI